MTDIVERLRLLVPSDSSGAAFDAVNEITRLRNELHIAQEWSAQVIAGQKEDVRQITALRAEVERLRGFETANRLNAAQVKAQRAEVEQLTARIRELEGALKQIDIGFVRAKDAPAMHDEAIRIARAALPILPLSALSSLDEDCEAAECALSEYDETGGVTLEHLKAEVNISPRAEVERLTARIRELEEARAALKGETTNRTQEDIEADRQAVLNRMRALIGSTAPRADFEWQQLQHKLQDLMVESWSILPLPQEASDE